MMTPELVAEMHSDRPGFRLIDYREVALPIYQVNTRLLVLARKPIAVIEEFVLKSIGAGLEDRTEIASFLGLDQRVINAALVNLTSSDDVALGPSTSSRRHVLRLTSKGKETTQNLASVVPETVEVPLLFDGILRRLRDYPVQFLTPRAVSEGGLLKIPPTRIAKPTVDDLTPESVQDLLRRINPERDAPRDVLSVKSLSNAERRYIPAVGLLYEAERGGEFQLGFAIDGVLSPEHESAFAAAGGPARLKIAETVRRSKEERTAELVHAIRTVAPKEKNVAIKRKTASQKRDEIRTLRAELKAEEDGPRIHELQSRVAELELSLAAERQKVAESTRFLYCFDHAPLLREAVATAKERLLIISPWVRAEVVDNDFRAALRALLKRGVSLYVGWGYPGSDKPSISASVESFFADLSRAFPNAHLKDLGDTHAKVLLVDDSYVVHTSFNWLSFRGDPDRTFRDEQGALIADPVMVNSKFEELVRRFT